MFCFRSHFCSFSILAKNQSRKLISTKIAGKIVNLNTPTIHKITNKKPITSQRIITMVQETFIPQALFNYEGRLSEGPTYNSSNNTLLWVDIIAGKIHRVQLPSEATEEEYTAEQLDSVKQSHEVFQIENESVGVIYLTNNDDLIYIGVRSGIASFKFSTKEFNYVFKYPEEASKLRSNDGNVDPTGEFIWAGLMGDFKYGPIDEGKLYKINVKTGKFETIVPSVLIPNGINWSKDSKNVYWTSSLDFKIYKFDYENGEIKNKRDFIYFKDVYPENNSPEPDGHCLTEDSHLFSAVWGTSTVAHFDADGKLVELFKFPAERISCAQFGGINRDELFVTTANLHLDEPEKLNDVGDDVGGSIFRIKLKGQKGLLRTKLNVE